MNICKKCKKCCNGEGTFVHQDELKLFPNPKVMKVKGKLYRFIGTPCQYLRHNGCILKVKPLSCIVYPFLPTDKGWILRTECPYYYKWKDEFENIKRIFHKRRRHWISEVKNG